MTNEEILTKAIQKAIDGGWGAYNPHDRKWTIRDIEHWFKFGEFASSQSMDTNYLKFLFSHDFAKAIWGEGPSKEWYVDGPGENKMKYTPSWQYHLKQMVVADDPIAYLGANI